MMQKYEEILDLEEAKRALEWQAREARIKKSMDRMGGVIAKSNEAEKQFDNRILRDTLLKAEKDTLKEKKAKLKVKQRDLEVRKQLDE